MKNKNNGVHSASKEDKKDNFERSAILPKMELDSKVLSNWFWVGLFLSGPLLTFILGHDKPTELHVRTYSIFCVFAATAILLIYRKWKGLSRDDPSLKNLLSTKIFMNFISLVTGNLIGFSITNFIVNIL